MSRRKEGSRDFMVLSHLSDMARGAMVLCFVRVLQAHLDIEKGVVIGENRMRNDTQAIMYERSVCTHFGAQSRACARAPLGVESIIHG